MGIEIESQQFRVVESGRVVVNGKRLLDVVKILRGGDITVEKIDNSLQIYQGRSRFKLSIFEDDQFPKFPNIAGKRKLAVDSKGRIIFKGALKTRIIPKFLLGLFINSQRFSIWNWGWPFGLGIIKGGRLITITLGWELGLL